jgi:CRP/FNR family transcriptional regulator, cyclic AMP receptor protein
MLDVHMSQPELTKLVATSLPTLQRVMRRFACDRPVINKYARIQLMDRDALERLCRS